MIQIQSNNGFIINNFSMEAAKKRTKGEFSQKMQEVIEEDVKKN